MIKKLKIFIVNHIVFIIIALLCLWWYASYVNLVVNCKDSGGVVIDYTCLDIEKINT